METCRTIDDLYDEVKEFDLVVTNDAPLATALNNRKDTARLGPFAVTARQVANMLAPEILKQPVFSDLRVISEISRETGYGIKYVHGEVENIRRIRRHTKEVEKYLYSKASKLVYRSFVALPTIEKVMDGFVAEESDFFKGKSVAVIGVELFDDLDKHMYPDVHEDVEVLSYRKDFEINTIYEVGNDRQIAENAVDLIKSEDYTNTAIVMDVGGPIADAVRSALYRRNIPFKNNMTVKDLSQIRDFIEFLTSSLSYETIRVKHIRELISAYGETIPSKYDEYLVRLYAGLEKKERILSKLSLMQNIRSFTFNEVCDKLVRSVHRAQIRMLLDDMRLKDEMVTAARVNDISYAVNNINDLHHNEQIPDSEKIGVLLVDCSNSVYIDRPLVLYLGMGQEWATPIIGKEYINRMDQGEKDALKFGMLLQQGTSQIYIVNSTRNGKEARPCLLFDEIFKDKLKGPAENFGKICSELIKGSWYEPEEVQRIDMGETSYDSNFEVGSFSKTSLNHFRTCPRAYFFNVLTPSSDSESTAIGNAIHEFAEFCFCYPEEVEAKGIEFFSDRICEKCAGLMSPESEKVDKSHILAMVRNVRDYISEQNRSNVKFDIDINSRLHPNNLFLELGKEFTSDATESSHNSDSTPLYGEFDLLINGKIIDYKTGKPKDLKSIYDGMESKSQYLELQPLVYLALMDDCKLGKGEFNLFFAAENLEESFSGTNDVKKNVRRIVITEESRRSFINTLLKDNFSESPIYSKVYDQWDSFSSILDYAWDSGPENWPKSEQLILTVKNRLNLPQKTSEGAVKRASAFLSKKIIVTDNQILIPRETLESFKENVRENHKEVISFYGSNFPAKPVNSCEKCNFFQLCTGDILIGGEEDE